MLSILKKVRVIQAREAYTVAQLKDIDRIARRLKADYLIPAIQVSECAMTELALFLRNGRRRQRWAIEVYPYTLRLFPVRNPGKIGQQ